MSALAWSDAAMAASSVLPTTSEDIQQCQQSHQAAQLENANSILAHEEWQWIRLIFDAMTSKTMMSQCVLFFLRLFEATNLQSISTVLDDMDSWREHQTMLTISKTDREGLQAIYLLGLDKQMNLSREP